MTPQKPRPKRDDDIDDFMASIFRNEAPKQRPAPLFARPSKPKLQEKPAPQRTMPVSLPRTSATPAPKAKRVKKQDLRITLGKPVLGVAVAATLVLLIFLLWQGPLQSVLYPSPFSGETKQKMGDTPLYFPQSLPKGYKIEKDTMKFPSDKVVVFAASDDTGNAITFSLQSKPSGLNTKPFTDKLTSTTTVKTSDGEATIGDDTDGKRIVSYVTDKIWLLITVRKDQIPAQELEAIVKSLKEG